MTKQMTSKHMTVTQEKGALLDVVEYLSGNQVQPQNIRRVACAIIARSSGLFQNPKRFCACDGISIWEERNVPDAGIERSKISST